MRRWYYMNESSDRVAIPETDMYLLSEVGVIRPQTLVWTEGMEEWMSAGEIHPELFGDAAGPAPTDVPTVLQMVRSLSAPLGRSVGVARVAGYLLLLTSLALVGAVVVATVVGVGAFGERWWLTLCLLPLAGLPALAAGPLFRVAKASRLAYSRADRGAFYEMSRSLGNCFWALVAVWGTGLVLALATGIVGFIYRVEVVEFLKLGSGAP